MVIASKKQGESKRDSALVVEILFVCATIKALIE